MLVCAEKLLLVSSCSFTVSHTMEEKQEPRTIELNDGNRMPILGLGTWKVPSCLVLRISFDAPLMTDGIDYAVQYDISAYVIVLVWCLKIG